MSTGYSWEGKDRYGSFRLRMNVWVCRQNCEIPWQHVPYLSASAVVIHYEEALYQVYAPLTATLLNSLQGMNADVGTDFRAIYVWLREEIDEGECAFECAGNIRLQLIGGWRCDSVGWAISLTVFGASVTNLNEPSRALAASTRTWVRS